MVLSCYSMTGTLEWQKVVGQFYSRHGFCSPPILYKNLVIVNGDQDAEAYLAALDKNTGRPVWRNGSPAPHALSIVRHSSSRLPARRRWC